MLKTCQMKKIMLVFCALFWWQPLLAADLVDVYCQALKCDPTFKAAWADLLANRENIPINRALLLPRLDIHAQAERQRVNFTGINLAALPVVAVTSVTFTDNASCYYLKLSQPIFNYTGWAKLQRAKVTVKQAEANFCAAAQDLMVRVVRAYFDVLIADANLFYTREHKKAVAEQLRDTREQFKVGLVPITNVYESLANYDLIIAEEISNRYELAKKIEALRRITNLLYCDLKGLNAYLPLVTPQPPDINAWVCITEKQNFQLLAARYAALAARENIKVQASDRLPVIDAFGEYHYDYVGNFEGTNTLYREKILEGGVELNWSPIQGGAIIARTNQAAYQYQQACADQEYTHRQVVSNARNAYLGIFAQIAKVRADLQAILSSQVSLKATIESYRVGTRTILDVLNQETQLYNAETTFAQDRYEFIYQTVLLKRAAGTLTVDDLQYINCWLYSTVDISLADALLEGCLSPSAQFRALEGFKDETSVYPVAKGKVTNRNPISQAIQKRAITRPIGAPCLPLSLRSNAVAKSLKVISSPPAVGKMAPATQRGAIPQITQSGSVSNAIEEGK
jgi:outer membrane protein